MQLFQSELPWASEVAFRQIFNSVNDAIFLHDVSGRLIDVNQTMLKMYGVSREQAFTFSIEHDYSSPESPIGDLKSLWAKVVAGENQLFEWKARRPGDGSVFDVEVFLTKIVLSGNEAVLATVRDITERKRLEAQYRHAQKMEAIGRLAGGIAHDFNNLLTVISGFTELLLARTPAAEPAHADLEEIRNASRRAASLTRQLLAFSRKQVLTPKVLDLNAVISEIEKLIRRLMGEDVTLTTVLCPALGKVKADPSQLEQVIMNLAVNARDAMPVGGKLSIETDNAFLDETYCRDHVGAEPGPYVLFAISDTGQGMDQETQARIFEPFFTTKELGKGTGLGLSTVFGIVKQSGGNIWVYSEAGRGTTFKVYLPRVDEALEPAEPRELGAGRGSETVLIVEDDEKVRLLVRTVLAAEGYTVLEAESADEALLFRSRFTGTVHLLLTDMVLPEMSGSELAERLLSRHPDMRVLFMSGYTDHGIVNQGTLAPGTAFLQKPFTPQALSGKVREVLDLGVPDPRF